MIDISGDINGIPKLYIIALVACVVIATICMINLYFTRSARDKKLRSYAEAFEESIEESKRRLGLIDRHAKDYLADIDPKVRGELQIAKRLIAAAERSSAAAQSHLAKGTYGEMLEAEIIFDTPLRDDKDAMNALITRNEIPGVYPHQLDETVDIIFQRVGEEVAKASSKAKRLGFKPRTRSKTAESLVDAGVRYLNRQRRRINSKSQQRPKTT